MVQLELDKWLRFEKKVVKPGLGNVSVFGDTLARKLPDLEHHIRPAVMRLEAAAKSKGLFTIE